MPSLNPIVITPGLFAAPDRDTFLVIAVPGFALSRASKNSAPSIQYPVTQARPKPSPSIEASSIESSVVYSAIKSTLGGRTVFSLISPIEALGMAPKTTAVADGGYQELVVAEYELAR